MSWSRAGRSPASIRRSAICTKRFPPLPGWRRNALRHFISLTPERTRLVAQPAPTRTAKHDALEVFAGKWQAEGTAYGDPEATGDAKANRVPWVSTHDAHWHTGS